MLVATMPPFSQRHDDPRSTLFELASQRRFDELADLAEQIFPGVDTSAAALSGI